MSSKRLPIKDCRVCNSKDLKEILILGNFYLSDFLKSSKKPKKYPLDIVLCKDCFLLQLKYTVLPIELYTPRYGYKSGINDTMKNELKEIVDESIKRAKLRKNKNPLVIDIGANDGTLLKYYSRNYFRVGVEPVRKLAKEAEANADLIINDFFGYKSYYKNLKNKKASIVTIISCFYDMGNPNQFLEDVVKILDDEGIIVIQQNYLGGMLRLSSFDNIVHEHLAYYSLLSLENLLNRHGLFVFDVELNDTNGGSFRTFISFKASREESQSVINLRKNEKKIGLNKTSTYTDFAKRVKIIGKKINNFIKEETAKGKTVYVYGASTRGNTLLQYFQLNNRLIKKAVERNPEKWGKKISSLGIPIISEEQARKEKPDYMLVLPWFFKEEFLKREKSYLKSGGHFIFPLPEFKVI